MTHAPLALIADPDPGALVLLCSDLGRAGYRTIAAAEIDEALAQARAHGPALIVTELWFRDGGGLSVIERWTAAQLPARLVVVTGMASIDLAVAAVRLGAADVLTKPVSASEVLAAAGQGPRPAGSPPPLPTVTLAEATATRLRAVVPGSTSLSEAARRLGLERRSLRRILDRYRCAPRPG